MQNKGFVKVFAVLLTLVCLFYLSFTYFSKKYTGKVGKDEKVWFFGLYTLEQCQENEVGLGLDLQGGLSVTMEVSVPDLLITLSGDNKDADFNAAITTVRKAIASVEGVDDPIALFVESYKKESAGKPLANVFATAELQRVIKPSTSDEDVVVLLHAKLAEAVDNSYVVVRSRVDRFGVAQPNIQKLIGGQGRIVVELPGVKEPDRVLDILKGSTNLQFWETYNLEEIQNVIMPSIDRIYSRVVLRDTAYANLVRMLPNQLNADRTNISSSLVGYFHVNDTSDMNKFLAMEEAKTLPRDLNLLWGASPVALEPEGAKEFVELYAIRDVNRDGKAPLQGDVISDAEAGFTGEQTGVSEPCVNITMNSASALAWANITEKNVGRSVAIVLDDVVYSAPTVNERIAGGRCVISGNFTIEETHDLANVLSSGKMLAPMNIVDSQILGPSLGEEAINQGLISFLVAFIVLMIYMCAIYGLIPGMVANMALILNLFFTLGILASFQAALTMSGIAGIVLTLGMAVDANVLIYERTKEELRGGKKVSLALTDGYKNAFSAIFDSNFTSIITGIILYNFGSGPIKGFAITLIIGLLCSFFTAVFVTRLVFEHKLNKNKWQNLTFTTGFSKKLMRDNNFNFMGSAKKSLIIFSVFVVVMVGSLFLRGLNAGIDFTGGHNYIVQFEKEVSADDVDKLLAEKMSEANIQVVQYGTDGKQVRISTNYLTNDPTITDPNEEIEKMLFAAFKEGGYTSEDLTLEEFRARKLGEGQGASIMGSQNVGASIAKDIRDGAVISVLLSLIAIFIYILVRFRNTAFSYGSIVALHFDVIMIIGCYALFRGILPFSLEIDQTFIGAILTAIGYSINDKVVVFDRVREFSHLYPKRAKFDLFNTSLNTTLSRTINTSVSTMVVLLCIFFLGGDSIRSFSFAMILGVVFGTLSSLFIAAPVAMRCITNAKFRKLMHVLALLWLANAIAFVITTYVL